MTSTKPQHADTTSPTMSNFAIDTIDAHTQARDTVKDFSAIFELLTHLDDEDLCTKRIARLLYSAGIYHATDKLTLLEEQISEAYKALEELKASKKSDFPF